ncbi:type I restriction endonuclease subunit R [Myxococcota bacterium]|nr:type I restriction endonuclease subunit R [Myxococcota bacterium]
MGQSEAPAVELLKRLGYVYASPESLEDERETLRQVVLVARLESVLKRLNPWISDDNLHKAVRAVTNVPAASLIEANEKLYTALTYGIALEQDLGDGRKSQQVRFFDFEAPDRNDFLVTRQYKVKGAKKHILPDVVCFVNGIPLAVIECKSPGLGEGWKAEAIDQFDRYQEGSEKYKELGAPLLFQSVQLNIATCGQDAVYGTVATPARFYARWKEPYPMSVAQVGGLVGKSAPSPQDVTIAGLLSRENLLDVVRNFITFERDPSTGRMIKKLPRYHQFGAVNKALKRSSTGKAQGKSAEERGGVVWHTQGSGKSLTMLWLALKLRRDPANENPTLVLVTDRRDLDRQITGVFQNCGFPNPERAESVKDLRRLLSGPSGKTVMTTVQKFQEAGGISGDGKRIKKLRHPMLSESSNIFVMTDEAHRTQYGSLGANLRAALPNAVFFGFTGTPIDKKDRSTISTFGSYIDQYTIEQAVKDEATVPIFYESRMADLHIIGQTLDQVFDRVFADRSDEERAAIKRRYATEQAISEAPRRIEAICLDLIKHYTTYIEPGGFKAQIVTTSRRAAVAYKAKLDELNGPQSAVVMSGSNKDDAELVAQHTSAEDRKQLVSRFLRKDDPLKILIVCDMLLTGFDAPIEQVMYLDSPLKEHTLLQAIARVNRTADHKDYGLIVDYWGVSDALQEALSIFSPSDIKGAMEPKTDEMPRLQARHAVAMRFFAAVRDKNDLEQCVAVLEPEDVRAEFQTAFRRFSQSMDMLLPDPAALDYVGDLGWLGKIRQAAKARYRDETLDISDCGEKVRKLIQEAIMADGVQILIKEVNLFGGDLEEKLGALKSDEAKASEMEHAIRHEIHVKLEEDPAYYQTLRERLLKIIEDRKAKRIDEAEQLSLLQRLVDDVRGHEKAAEGAGLSETAFAIYGLLKGAEASLVAENEPSYGDDRTREVAQAIEHTVEPYIKIVDWGQKSDVQREIRSRIKRRLPSEIYSSAEKDRLAAALTDLLRVRKGK